jgi:single-stranded DNA-specific DHH superfamily exonuclease
MTHFDVFNGDADGICALIQLRLAAPVDSSLVTGTKRDVALLGRVAAQPGDFVTALDISLAANAQALARLLAAGVDVQYFDHHYAGPMPTHPRLDAHIDTSPSLCTGILVDRYLEGRHRVWAVVAAYGDNLGAAARDLASPLVLTAGQLAALQELGESLTYNAYGDDEQDMIVHPAELFRTLLRSGDPFRFMHTQPLFRDLTAARRRDLELARAADVNAALQNATVYILPDAPWSRRVRGIFANELANAAPGLAHAVLSPGARGGYTVSVRAPLAHSDGADALCRQFATGGGRAAAAGIDHLPVDQVPEFIRRLNVAFA